MLNANAPLATLPNFGRHTASALARYGIKTIGQFALFTEKEVCSLLGPSGRKLLLSAKQVVC